MAIDIGVNLDPDTATATVYIAGSEFELKSREEADAVKKNIDAVFTAINWSTVFPKTEAKRSE